MYLFVISPHSIVQKPRKLFFKKKKSKKNLAVGSRPSSASSILWARCPNSLNWGDRIRLWVSDPIEVLKSIVGKLEKFRVEDEQRQANCEGFGWRSEEAGGFVADMRVWALLSHVLYAPFLEISCWFCYNLIFFPQRFLGLKFLVISLEFGRFWMQLENS